MAIVDNAVLNSLIIEVKCYIYHVPQLEVLLYFHANIFGCHVMLILGTTYKNNSNEITTVRFDYPPCIVNEYKQPRPVEYFSK